MECSGRRQDGSMGSMLHRLQMKRRLSSADTGIPHRKYENKGSEFGDDADFTPYYGPGVIGIDACTAHSGMVNCLVIDD